jgi:glucose-1-phosphate adenylyltransferase
MDHAWIDAHGVRSQGRDCIASMGIYLFNRQRLLDVLTKTEYQDFGREIFPASIRSQHVHVHLFDDYWEDIGTIRAFYDANLALTKVDAPFDLTAPEAPVYSRARFLPPSRLDDAHVSHSLIADGCRIAPGARVENSIIGVRCLIGSGVTILNSIIMGSDEYETDEEVAAEASRGRPPVGIGAGSSIIGSIVDKNCRIGRNVRIENRQRIENADWSDCCIVRDAIPVVSKDSIIADETQFG